MNSTDELSSLYQQDAFLRSMVAARRKATQAFNLRRNELDEEHQELEAAQSSPYIEDFEECYRAKIALGRISLFEAAQKIRSAIWVPPEITRHMVKHLALRPPSAEEIAFFEEFEAQKELQRLKAQAREQEAAMAQVAMLLYRLEKARIPRRSRLDYLTEVKVRGRSHLYYDLRRNRSISVRDYLKRVRISKARLARKRVES